MKQRVADYIADFLADKGVDTVFSVVGGGAMHLNDAFGRHAKLRVIHNHHEQASAMAAEGYARINERPAAVCVTTGPGGTNAMTGVLGAWQDNVPMIVVSGQVRYSTTVENSGLKLRQFGEQEYYIVQSVKPMTKFAYMVKNASEIKYILEKAYYLAMSGRRGPVWIDVPLNIQGAEIETEDLRGFDEPEQPEDYVPKAEMILRKLGEAKKPLILAGAAIRRSGSYEVFRRLINILKIPVLSPTCTADILPLEHPLYFRNYGIIGGRAGNFLLQNADVVLSLGCRGSLKQIGFNYEAFAPQAYTIFVDIDTEELRKKTLHINMPVIAELKSLLKAMLQSIDVYEAVQHEYWLEYAHTLIQRFPIEAKADTGVGVNPYGFADILLEELSDDGIIVTGNSSGPVMLLHCGVHKEGQRLFSNLNCGSMGWDLPAAMGAAVAAGRTVICSTGDGSVQMNLQELQTVVLNKIPVKLIIFSNNGYAGVVRTQNNFFAGRLTGCTPESGLDCPNFEKLAYAYDIPYVKLESLSDVKEKLSGFISSPGYGICELMEDSTQGPAFKTTSRKLPNGEMVSAPLDELAPKLDAGEYNKYRYFEKYLWQEHKE